METLHKDGGDDDHHKIRGMMIETIMITKVILFIISCDHICACDVIIYGY
jgi:hypothetical protein